MGKHVLQRSNFRAVFRSSAALLSAGLLLAAATQGAPPPYVGLALEEALLALQARGLQLVFTDHLVRPTMQVEAEPQASTPRRILDELLHPHGLEARDGIGARIVIVPATAPTAEPPTAEPPADQPPLLIAREAINVTARHPRLLGDALSTLTLDRDEALSLPHLGDDLFRALTLLPGTSGNDASARFQVRGGRPDEVQVRLDGFEILEPFHLKDFNEALSILAPRTIAQIELRTGGFPVEYGDRMSGVLDMTTVDPRWRRRTTLGLSLLNAQANSSGTWAQGKGDWLGSLRGGSLELPFRLVDEEENPQFWDGFAKVRYALRPSHSLRAHLLASHDELDFVERDDAGFERFSTRYSTANLWFTQQLILGQRLYFETRASLRHVGRNRDGREDGDGGALTLNDKRDLEVGALGQDWNWQRNDRHTFKWGFEARILEADYDYFNERSFEDPLAAIRYQPAVGSLQLDRGFRGRHISLYGADRMRLSQRATLEAGLRYDKNTVIDDGQLSPRLSMVYALPTHGLLRAAVGRYAQSQRLYELQVEDAETTFSRAEQADQWLLGYERTWAAAPQRPLTLRAEFYRRRVRNPRVRYENLYEPISIVPELQPDRVRIAPQSSLAQGIELFLNGAAGRRIDWFLSYTYATTEDHLDGRDVPRSYDQPHSVGLDLHYRAPWRLDIDLAWRYHSGWPTTAITAHQVPSEDGTMRIVPTLGPLYGERLPTYNRLDLRIGRRWSLRRGEIQLAFGIQNVAKSRNVRGFDITFEPGDGETVQVRRETRSWGRRLPSLEILWTF